MQSYHKTISCVIYFPTCLFGNFCGTNELRAVKCQIFNDTHIWYTKIEACVLLIFCLKLKKSRIYTLNSLQVVCPWDRHQHGNYTTTQKPGSLGCHSEFLVWIDYKVRSYCKEKNYFNRIANDISSDWWFMPRSQEVYW